MKMFLSVLLVFACCVARAGNSPSDEVVITSTKNREGKKVAVHSVSAERFRARPDWDPNTAEIPFSPHAAAKIALAWWQQRYPDLPIGGIDNVTLRTFPHPNEQKWYYLFYLRVPWVNERVERDAWVYVLMDGSVVDETKLTGSEEQKPKPAPPPATLPNFDVPGDRVLLVESTDTDKKTSYYIVDYATLDKCPSWNGETEPPISIGQAIAKAREWLKPRDPCFSSGETDRFSLQKVNQKRHKDKDKWYYCISFRCQATVDGIDQKKFATVYVLMDGTIVQPSDKKE